MTRDLTNDEKQLLYWYRNTPAEHKAVVYEMAKLFFQKYGGKEKLTVINCERLNAEK